MTSSIKTKVGITLQAVRQILTNTKDCVPFEVQYYIKMVVVIFTPHATICPVAQLVACLFANLGDTNLNPAWPYTFVEIDGEIVCLSCCLVTSESMWTEYWLTA